jgi:hypothetical protein
MAYGGARPGAGHPKGSATKRTREIADRAVETGLMTPLEALLAAMQSAIEAGDWDKVTERAAKAAPYVHPRLASVEHGGPDNGPMQAAVTQMTREEFEETARQILSEI